MPSDNRSVGEAVERLSTPRTVPTLYRALQASGFWAAIVLPLVVLGLLITGLAVEHPGAFMAVLAANVAGLVFGREYRLDSGSAD